LRHPPVDGKTHYGDRLYERAAGILHVEESTLRNYKYMAEVLQLSLRNDKLGWHHHYEVASLKQIRERPDGKLTDAYAPLRQAARERQGEGQKAGGHTAGRGRPKADSSVQQISQTYPKPQPKPREQKSLKPGSAFSSYSCSLA
jgi:hypothetical protein